MPDGQFGKLNIQGGKAVTHTARCSLKLFSPTLGV
jgi:hypothetical protein